MVAVCYLMHFTFDVNCLCISIVVITCMPNYFSHTYVVVGRSERNKLAEEGMPKL